MTEKQFLNELRCQLYATERVATELKLMLDELWKLLLTYEDWRAGKDERSIEGA